MLAEIFDEFGIDEGIIPLIALVTSYVLVIGSFLGSVWYSGWPPTLEAWDRVGWSCIILAPPAFGAALVYLIKISRDNAKDEQQEGPHLVK